MMWHEPHTKWWYMTCIYMINTWWHGESFHNHNIMQFFDYKYITCYDMNNHMIIVYSTYDDTCTIKWWHVQSHDEHMYMTHVQSWWTHVQSHDDHMLMEACCRYSHAILSCHLHSESYLYTCIKAMK